MVSAPIRIANCSAFYGDRLSAAREMVDGGPIDVLSGDWLAELTMLVLAKDQRRDRAGGYAHTFLAQMEQVMGGCLDRGVKVVSNAGGLSPGPCAEAIEALADKLGLDPVVAYVEGDNLLPRLDELRAAGVVFSHMKTGEPLGNRPVLSANAYLGGWGIAEALRQGADIVVTGRVTDAALVLGPAAWRHEWQRDNWDALAGAVVAGHVIEGGTQATGGNYAFFRELPGLEHPGFPIAEVAADGGSVITKHPGQGGQVSTGTVTAQLLTKIDGPAYLTPDVTARFDSIRLTEVGTNRVRISGVKGDSPPTTTKVAINYQGGFRSTTTLYLAGLDIEEKAALLERALWASLPGGREALASADVTLLRTDRPDPSTNEEAFAELRITVKDPDEHKVGRAFSARVTELAQASYPGLFTDGLTAGATAYGGYWPALLPASAVWQEVVIGGHRTTVDPVACPSPPVVASVPLVTSPVAPGGTTVRAPLGRAFGARSANQGGNATLGVWARSGAGYRWLTEFLTVPQLQGLLPEMAVFHVDRSELPNLRALNFVIHGLLGEGGAASSRLDPEAKSLGEWLRARTVDATGHAARVMEMVRYEVVGGVATLTMDQPENRNAMTVAMLNGLGDGLAAAVADRAVRVVVLTNTGPAFSAGANLSADRGEGPPEEPRFGLADVLAAILDSPKPVVARIAGHCVGGGVGLAAACDLSVAREDVRFGFSEVRLGVAPAIISVVCLPKLRRADALELFLTGERISAGRAAAVGLITSAVPADELDQSVGTLVDKLMVAGPAALAAAKRLVFEVPPLDRRAAFERTTALSADLFASAEAAEGIAAFREKRQPAWVPTDR